MQAHLQPKKKQLGLNIFEKIKWFKRFRLLVKRSFDSIDNSKVKLNILNALPFWVAALLSGIVAVFYAKLFGWAEQGTHYLFNLAHWSIFIFAPISFGFAVWIVIKYAPFARGSGIPQVSAANHLSTPKNIRRANQLLGFRIIIVKIISSIVMVFGGGVVGREGPTIQISASIFKKINEWLPAWYPKISRRNMIVTGAASGLAAAFNTPLGGIVFAIEELTKTHFSYFKTALLTGVIISGLTALNFLGPYLYIGYPELGELSLWLIIIIIPLAALAGVLSSGMGQSVLAVFKQKKKLKKNYQRVGYAVVAGLLIAAIAYFIDYRVVGSGKGIMIDTLFSDNKTMEWYMPILRIVGPIICFTTGAAGGIFAPSLSAGSALGAFVAGFLDLNNTDTNLIILCGMTGFLSGITRSPFTSSILVIEMTSSHSIIMYVMITALVANLAANLVCKKSFYDQLKDSYIEELESLDEKEQGPIMRFIQKNIIDRFFGKRSEKEVTE